MSVGDRVGDRSEGDSYVNLVKKKNGQCARDEAQHG